MLRQPSFSSSPLRTLRAVIGTNGIGSEGGGVEATTATIQQEVQVVRIIVDHQPFIAESSIPSQCPGKDRAAGSTDNDNQNLQGACEIKDNEEEEDYDDDDEGKDGDENFHLKTHRSSKDRDMIHKNGEDEEEDADDEDNDDDDDDDDDEDDDDGDDEEEDEEDDEEMSEDDLDDEDDQLTRDEDDEERVNRVFSRDNSSSSDTAAVASGVMKGGGDREGDFEASLLLHIGTPETNIHSSTGATSNNHNTSHTSDVDVPMEKEEQHRFLRERGGSEIHDPTTLPTSMTSFLDILTEEQRRVRHRHIPSVDGFRRLYKNEIKSDITLARRSCRKQPLQSRRSSNLSKSSSDECGDGSTTLMDVDDNAQVSECVDEHNEIEQDEEEEDGDKQEGTAKEENDENEHDSNIDESNGRNIIKKNKIVGDAFIVPTRAARQCALGGQFPNLLESIDFEHALSNGSTMSSSASAAIPGTSLSSSTTTTTTSKKQKSVTDVPIPSSTSTPDVSLTTTAKSPKLVCSITTFNPPHPQESTSLKTLHRMKRWEANPSEIEVDLRNYRKTVRRTQEELHVAEEERVRVENVSSLMRTNFMEHLKKYRAEVLAMNEGLESTSSRCCKLLEDKHLHQFGHVGGVMATKGGSVGNGGSDVEIGMEDMLSILRTVEREDAVNDAPKSIDEFADWRRKGVGGISGRDENITSAAMANGWFLVGDEVIVNSTGDEGIIVSVHGTNVGLKSNVETNEENKKNVAIDVSVSVKPPLIDVKLSKSGHIQTYTPAEIEFNPSKRTSPIHLSDSALAKRWQCMIGTALSNSANHDLLAMEDYTNSSFVHENIYHADASEADAGAAPSKSEILHHEERILLPFGSGLIAAPEDVKNGPSVIPLDNLEETIRMKVYGSNTPRIIPVIPPTLRSYESRKEEMNVLRGKVVQLRNRLGRQKRLRILNEQSLIAGKSRAKKFERLLLEMKSDLMTLKERLRDELNELGIGSSTECTESRTIFTTADETEKYAFAMDKSEEASNPHEDVLNEESVVIPLTGEDENQPMEPCSTDNEYYDRESKRARMGEY